MNRTRIVAASPSGGIVMSCVSTTRPSLSTTSGNFSPANPVCVTTTSTTSDVPFSAVRGVSTRLT
ncbi:MAG: hypothetical protein P3A28_07900 [Gemmatimonadota bacterium]|nr:hypothetical protein [Gemmatimonadota bacterium]